MNGRSTHYPETRPRAATVRSRLMLEVASELVGESGFDPKQVKIQFRDQGTDSWILQAFGSDALSAVPEVAAGGTQFAILNPASLATKALLGSDPFDEPIPLRAIATIPSHDQLGVAVATDLGVVSLEELAQEDKPLVFSLRGARPDHSIHHYVADLFDALALNNDVLDARGTRLEYHEGIPHQGERREMMATRGVDVIIDEGIYNWVDLAIDSGYRFLSFSDGLMGDMERRGYRSAVISSRDYAKLDHDVRTLDFSGFLIYTHADVSDDLVERFCRALVARRERIPWQGGPTLPLEQMVVGAVDAPLPIPFHPAAEAVWREVGVLT